MLKHVESSEVLRQWLLLICFDTRFISATVKINLSKVLVHMGSQKRDRALEVWKQEHLLFRTNVSTGPST